MKISIIESGIGNVQSVVNCCNRQGYNVSVAFSAESLEAQNPDRIILPGVGTIGKAIENLKKNKLWETLNKTVIEKKVPFLGICLGMQLLATKCFEFENFDGLNWIPGKVNTIFEFNKKFKIPHVGWNSLNITKTTDSIFKEFDGNDFYFIHSQSFKCDKKYIVATTNYNIDFVSVVRNDHILGVQFHPEKSSIFGEKLIRNFINNKYD